MKFYSSTIDFLSDLNTKGIEIWVEKNKLCINARQGVIDEELRNELKSRKDEILKFLNESIVSVNRDVIPARSESFNRAIPVSFSQERLWFLSQLDPNSAAYKIPYGVRIKGNLDIFSLEKSLSEIVRRHEVLRTTFSEVDDLPVQVIQPATEFNLEVFDVAELPEADRDRHAEEICLREAQKPFDLSTGPLFRAVLVRLRADEHIFFSVMHHIITDGWSFGIFFHEIESLYKSFIQGQPSSLPPMRIQYADYAIWQRDWLNEKTLEEKAAYWIKRLGDEPPVLQLPTDMQRPAVQSHRGTVHYFTIPAELTERIKNLSHRQNSTLFMTLLAAFKAVMHRYTGQTDFAVGTAVANRNRTELEQLIGFFINTLTLRTDLSGNPSFIDLLVRVRETAMGAFSHQEMPFEKLVEILRPARNMSHSPLFQVMFIFLNAPRASVDLPGLTLTPVKVDIGASMFDLTLYIWEEAKAISCRVEYSTDLFEAATIQRMSRHYVTFMKAAVDNPDRSISTLPMLNEDERDQLLVGWNATDAIYPRDNGFGQLFEEQAALSADAVAVGCRGKELSYRELNARVNRLACYLRQLGVGPDVFVGILMERSVDMVVGLLGVLKAGGAYVPLDPGFPKERLEFMLEDSGAPILITQQSLSQDLSSYLGQVVCIDSDWERISQESPENPQAVGSAEDLAYMIYTSGSTGKPKGVQISHRALVNFLYSMSREPGLSSTDAVLSVTTISFDIFGLELYLPLLKGARVVLAERDDAIDGVRLMELLSESKATVMQATPATWRLLLQAGWEGDSSLRVFCGGEALPQDLVGPILKRCKELWNLYGPTETTIWSTVYQIKSKDDPILIGHPIANTQVYVLDGSLQPTPIGVIGELYIGGDGLARGYWNRPELTAQNFITSPFSEDLKERIYRTGDLARYRPDGSLECLGRIDHQVKLRGFRIELGEIEATLAKLDDVRQCAVAVREDRPGDQRLVAYYVSKTGAEASISDWRNYLRTKLPDYMVPQHYVKLEAMPLTPNGKVDRKALPKADIKEPSKKEDKFKGSAMEILLADVWKDVLGMEHVGLNDNFYEIGGYSLLSMRVVARVEKQIGIRLNPAEFIYQTLRQIAAVLEKKSNVVKDNRNNISKKRIFSKLKAMLK